MRSLVFLVCALALCFSCLGMTCPVASSSPQFEKTEIINAKIEAAKSHIENENFDAAKVLLNTVLTLDPQNSQAKQLLEQCKPVSISVSKPDLSFSHDGGSQSIYVYCSADWSISVYPTNWVQLSRSGNNIKVTVSPNRAATSRTDFFELKTRSKTVRVNISQSCYATPFSAYPSSLKFDAEGGTQTITVSANKYWYVGDFVPYWISPSATSGISDNGDRLIVTVDKNTSSQSRKGTIRLQTYDAHIEIQISQDGVIQAPFESSGTTRVPTCRGLGRKYLRDAVDKYGKCQMGALHEDGSGVVVYGDYGFARTAGLPSSLNKAIDDIYAKKYKFKSIAYSSLGYYCVIYGRNGWVGIVPAGLEAKLNEYNSNYDEIKCVSINQSGSYVVLSDKQFVASNPSHRQSMITARDKYGTIKYACITDIGICVVCANGVYYRNIPSALAEKLKHISFVPDKIVFTDCGSYLITNDAGNYSYNM